MKATDFSKMNLSELKTALSERVAWLLAPINTDAMTRDEVDTAIALKAVREDEEMELRIRINFRGVKQNAK